MQQEDLGMYFDIYIYIHVSCITTEISISPGATIKSLGAWVGIERLRMGTHRTDSLYIVYMGKTQGDWYQNDGQ